VHEQEDENEASFRKKKRRQWLGIAIGWPAGGLLTHTEFDKELPAALVQVSPPRPSKPA